MKKHWPWVMPALLVVLALAYLYELRSRSQRRIDEYTEAVYQYNRYSKAYEKFADEKSRNYFFETCYGSRWDRYSERLSQDLEARSGDEAYLRSKSQEFQRLSDKYKAALAQPDKPITLDPPLEP